jgi:protein TonB
MKRGVASQRGIPLLNQEHNMRANIAQRNQIGWGFSLVLHGLLLSAVWPIVHQLPMPIHPEPFRWDVTFVEPPQQNRVVEPTSETVGQNPAPPIQSPHNVIRETVQPVNDVRPEVAAPVPTVAVPPQPETSPPPSFTAEPTPITQDILPVQRDVPEQPKTMVAAAPVATEPSAAIAAPVEQELPPPPATPVDEVAMAPTQPSDLSPTSAASISPVASGQASAPRVDYSWLQRAVSRRLEELKRSSRPSLEDASKLKVLVKAVVSNTGELMEAEVVKSSGVTRIDQEAMTLVQRAFPMRLDYAIDRPQIVMRIPITYSRD